MKLKTSILICFVFSCLITLSFTRKHHKSTNAEDASLLEKSQYNIQTEIPTAVGPALGKTPIYSGRADLPYDRLLKNGIQPSMATVFSAPLDAVDALQPGGTPHNEVLKPLLNPPMEPVREVGVEPPLRYLRRPLIVKKNHLPYDHNRELGIEHEAHSVWAGLPSEKVPLGAKISHAGYNNLVFFGKRGGVGRLRNHSYRGSMLKAKNGVHGGKGVKSGKKGKGKGKYHYTDMLRHEDYNKGIRQQAESNFNSFNQHHESEASNQKQGHYGADAKESSNFEGGRNQMGHSGLSQQSGAAHSGGGGGRVGRAGHSFIQTESEQIIAASPVKTRFRGFPGGIVKGRFIPKVLGGIRKPKWGPPGVISSISNGVKNHTFIPGRIGFRKNLTPGYGPPGVISHAHNNAPISQKQHHLKKTAQHKSKKHKKQLKRIRGQQEYGEFSENPVADNSIPKKGKAFEKPRKQKPKKNVSKNY